MVDSPGSETNESETGDRQALLYCKTNNGRAAGMPVVKVKRGQAGNAVYVQLFRRQNYIHLRKVILDRIYFINKNFRCLSLIAITGDSGIEQVNLECPPRQKNGCLSTSHIKLACDWHQKGKIKKVIAQ